LRVIVVTGTPGVGKTTVSRTLADRAGAVYIDVNDLIRKNKLFSGYDRRRKTYIADLSKVAKRVRGIFEASDRDIILEGHIAHLVVPKESVYLAFVLRCSPGTLKERLQRKPYPTEKVSENVAAEVLDICLVETIETLGEARVAEIDTTNRTVEEVVDEMLETIAGNKKPSLHVVDWMTELELKGLLNQYVQ